MSDNGLTDRDYWEKYWSNYEYEKIPSKTIFEHLMPLVKEKNNFIEIGGFPGAYAAYFYKKGCKNVSLLDFFINKDVIHKFEEKNDLLPDTIKCIESDFFKYESSVKYDIVFSAGFIEHFNDTEDVVRRHVNLLSESGSLLMYIPNFRGLNGFIQRFFDKTTYDAHNLNCMNIKYLKTILQELGLKNIVVEYSHKPMVWLEPGVGSKLGRMFIKFLSHSLKLFPFRTKFLSPFIIIYGEN